MKSLAIIIFIFLLIPGNLQAKEKRTQGDKKLFLAYNVWETPNDINQRCINYKTGRLIPAGTEVVKANVYERRAHIGMFAEITYKIVFKIKESDKEIRTYFKGKWHPGKTIYDYYDLMFTEQSFAELTANMNQEVLEHSRRGELIPGMSKPEVILTYGYPPEHVTPSLNGNAWIYWINKMGRKKICFDAKDKTINCSEISL